MNGGSGRGSSKETKIHLRWLAILSTKYTPRQQQRKQPQQKSSTCQYPSAFNTSFIRITSNTNCIHRWQFSISTTTCTSFPLAYFSRKEHALDISEQSNFGGSFSVSWALVAYTHGVSPTCDIDGKNDKYAYRIKSCANRIFPIRDLKKNSGVVK